MNKKENKAVQPEEQSYEKVRLLVVEGLKRYKGRGLNTRAASLAGVSRMTVFNAVSGKHRNVKILEVLINLIEKECSDDDKLLGMISKRTKMALGK